MVLEIMEQCTGGGTSLSVITTHWYQHWSWPYPRGYRQWILQSFKPTQRYSLVKTELQMRREGGPVGDSLMHLYRATDGHLPMGEILATATIPEPTSIVTYTWYECYWSPSYVVEADVQYCMVARRPVVGYWPQMTVVRACYYTQPEAYLLGKSTSGLVVLENSMPPDGPLPPSWLSPGQSDYNFKNWGEPVIAIATCNITTVLSGEIRGLKFNLASDIESQGNISAGLFQTVEYLEAVLLGEDLSIGTLTGNHIPLWAALGGLGGLTGELTGTLIALSGSIHGQSGMGGNLTVDAYIPPPGPPDPPPAETHLLVGEVNAQSGISGTLTVDRVLAGTIEGQSNIDGWLTVEDIRGQVDGQSNITGTLSVTRTLAGTIVGQSSINADRISIEGEVELWGTIDGQSNISGYLETSVTLRGIIAGQSDISGFLTNDDIRGVITGQSWIGSGYTGPGLIIVNPLLKGTIAAQSNISGTLSTYEPLFMISESDIEPYFLQSLYLNEELIIGH